MRHMRRLLREPLLHFLALGLGLFLLFRIVGGSSEAPPDRIVVSAARIEQLARMFARTWQRPPTERELAGLIEDHIREEIYYREALSMGLDRGDTVVRRRLRQKLEFVADDLVDDVDPTEGELASYLREHAERFREPARISFRQLYLSADRRGERIVRDAEELLRELERQPSDADVAGLGDPLMLATDYARVGRDAVERDFGGRFAAALDDLSTGRWSGPVESGFGLHLVQVRERIAGSLPPLAAIRDEVEREWRSARRKETEEAFYRTLRERYVIDVERPVSVAATSGSALAEIRP